MKFNKNKPPGFPSPVGDLYFSISIQDATTGEAKFPSPVGDLYFSIELNHGKQRIQNCFRPLSGTYISQSSYHTAVGESRSVSVPCRGLIFLNAMHGCPAMQRCPVSVPCRGLIFLNTISTTSCKYWLYCTLCVGNDFVEI